MIDTDKPMTKARNCESIDIVVYATPKGRLRLPLKIGDTDITELGIYRIKEHVFWIIRKLALKGRVGR